MDREASRNRRADDRTAALIAQRHTVFAGPAARARQPPFADRGLALLPRDRLGEASDQRVADGDRAASDGLVCAADRDAYAFSGDVRERTARHRQHTAQARLGAADARDAVAVARDRAASKRDGVATARDLAITERADAEQRHSAGLSVSGAEIVTRAAATRRRAAKRGAEVAEHLALVACDRAAAARDREHAAEQRRHALADRDALAHHVAIVETDALTGVRTGAAGMIDLDHERDRCQRGCAALVIAYAQIDAPSNVRDIRGHNDHDEVLRRVVANIHGQLRSYDLIIRFADNDFVCAMSNMTVPTARQRFDAIAASSPDAITTGFAALTSHESTIELIASAHSTRR